MAETTSGRAIIIAAVLVSFSILGASFFIGSSLERTPTELARLHGHGEAAELLERPSSKRPSRRRSSSGK